MELKEHWKIIKKAGWWIALFGVVVAVIAGYVTWQKPASYKVVQDYEVLLVNRSTTADYQYGSYYDLKGAESFTQYVMSILRSPAVIADIYQTAGVSYTIDNIDRFTNQFHTAQGASQFFTVTYSQYQRGQAEQLAEAMTTVLTEHVRASERATDGSSLFDLSASTPVIVYEEPNVWLSVVVGAVAGWLVGLVVVYLKRYLQ